MMHCLCFCLCACTCTCIHCIHVLYIEAVVCYIIYARKRICAKRVLGLILLHVFMHMCMICCCKYILPPSLPSSLPPSSINPPTATDDRSYSAETAATHQVTPFSPKSGVAILTTDSEAQAAMSRDTGERGQ